MTHNFVNDPDIKLLLRIQKKLHKSKRKHRILEFLYAVYIQLVYGGFIPVAADLGDNIVFPHGFNGVFISINAKIGDNCLIYQHVTIGSEKGEAPVIKNNVVIGAGAKIIGSITIGDNCRIGAGAVVTENIPDNCTVVLPKPRVIQRKVI